MERPDELKRFGDFSAWPAAGETVKITPGHASYDGDPSFYPPVKATARRCFAMLAPRLDAGDLVLTGTPVGGTPPSGTSQAIRIIGGRCPDQMKWKDLLLEASKNRKISRNGRHSSSAAVATD